MTTRFERIGRREIALMLDGLPDHEHAPHLTFIEPDDTYRHFGPSDRTALLDWWSTRWPACMADSPSGRLVVIRQDPTPMRVTPTDQPVMRLSMCILERGAMMALTADEARRAYNVDAETGMLLRPEPGLVFVDYVRPSTSLQATIPTDIV